MSNRRKVFQWGVVKWEVQDVLGFSVDSDAVRLNVGWGQVLREDRDAEGQTSGRSKGGLRPLRHGSVSHGKVDINYGVPQFWPTENEQGEVQTSALLLSGSRWYGHASSKHKLCFVKQLSILSWASQTGIPEPPWSGPQTKFHPRPHRYNFCEIVLNALNL